MQSWFAALAACALAACSSNTSPTTRTTPMSIDANKQLVRRLYEDYINRGKLDQLAEIVAPDFSGPGPARGPAAFSAALTDLRAAFPDLVYTVEDVVGEADRVAVRWTWRGTHTGTFRGYEATGRKIANPGFAVFQVVDGKLSRAWLETDRLGFLVAIGAVPHNPAFGPPPAAN